MIEGRQFDATFMKTMRMMWTQFARTGNPSLSADISPDGKAKEWPLYDLDNKQVMVLDEFDIHPAKEALGEQAGDGTRRVRHPSRQGVRREDRGLGQDLLPHQVLYALTG